MKGRLKGISPLIAVIMLIAFTMIVAGILASWSTNFAQRQRMKIEFCTEANAYIETASYDSATHKVTLNVFNNGKVPLTFITLLTYKNGTIVRVPGTWNISEGQIGTLTIPNVAENLKEITIQSQECPGVQDLIYYYDIMGL